MGKQAPVLLQILMEVVASLERRAWLVTLLVLSPFKAGVRDVENARRR